MVAFFGTLKFVSLLPLLAFDIQADLCLAFIVLIRIMGRVVEAKGSKKELEQDFSKSSSINILDWIILCFGGVCPVHFRMLITIFGLSTH